MVQNVRMNPYFNISSKTQICQKNNNNNNNLRPHCIQPTVYIFEIKFGKSYSVSKWRPKQVLSHCAMKRCVTDIQAIQKRVRKISTRFDRRHEKQNVGSKWNSTPLVHLSANAMELFTVKLSRMIDMKMQSMIVYESRVSLRKKYIFRESVFDFSPKKYVLALMITCKVTGKDNLSGDSVNRYSTHGVQDRCLRKDVTYATYRNGVENSEYL